MRRTHTLPLPLASQSTVSASASGELPSRQRRFKPPLLGSNGNQGVSASQGTRNGALVSGGTGVKNSPSVVGVTTTPVTRNAPPAPPPPSSFSSNGDSPQSCGGYRSSPSSADDSDVCVTPGVSHGQVVQVRHASDEARVDSSLGNTSRSKSVITSKPIPNHSGVPPKPNHSSVISKPNHSVIASKANPSNIHTPSNSHPDEDDNASLMIEDDPNDSSFGDIDMSFDMDALEETMKMYD